MQAIPPRMAERLVQMKFNPVKNPLDFVRLAFLAGAITDGLVIVPMLVPDIGAVLFGAARLQSEPFFTSFQGTAVSLMAGWTVLLFWGACQPIERRSLLLITAFPVVTGIGVSLLNGVAAGLMPIERIGILLVHLTLLTFLFIRGYFIADRMAKSETPVAGGLTQ